MIERIKVMLAWAIVATFCLGLALICAVMIHSDPSVLLWLGIVMIVVGAGTWAGITLIDRYIGI